MLSTVGFSHPAGLLVQLRHLRFKCRCPVVFESEGQTLSCTALKNNAAPWLPTFPPDVNHLHNFITALTVAEWKPVKLGID